MSRKTGLRISSKTSIFVFARNLGAQSRTIELVMGPSLASLPKRPHGKRRLSSVAGKSTRFLRSTKSNLVDIGQVSL